jgi:hypothetical protein
MKTYVHLWQYLARVFLEWEMFQTKVVEKIKTHILCSITFFLKSCRLWDNVEKCGWVSQATNATIRRMRFACRITEATDTHSSYAILIALARQQWLRERASTFTLHAHCLSCSNRLWNVFFGRKYSPIRLGNVTQAGPGLEYSAAIGPRRFVGVHGCCWMPPMLLLFHAQFRIDVSDTNWAAETKQ